MPQSGRSPRADSSAIRHRASAPVAQSLKRFVTSHRGDIACDLHGDLAFLASDQFSLNHEAERWKMIDMVTIREYHISKAP